MANGPEWIDNDRVDSTAMRLAYLEYCSNRTNDVLANDDAAQITLLPMIVHKSADPQPIEPTSVVLVECTTEGCQRCAQLRGGYEFHWYYHRWYAKYKELSWPGAWRLYDSGTDSTKEAVQHEPEQIGQVLSCPQLCMTCGVRRCRHSRGHSGSQTKDGWHICSPCYSDTENTQSTGDVVQVDSAFSAAHE